MFCTRRVVFCTTELFSQGTQWWLQDSSKIALKEKDGQQDAFDMKSLGEKPYYECLKKWLWMVMHLCRQRYSVIFLAAYNMDWIVNEIRIFIFKWIHYYFFRKHFQLLPCLQMEEKTHLICAPSESQPHSLTIWSAFPLPSNAHGWQFGFCSFQSG